MNIGAAVQSLAQHAVQALHPQPHDARPPAPPAAPPARSGSADTLERMAGDGTQQQVLARSGGPAAAAGPAAPARLSGDDLARKYAPVLILPPGQYNLPADPQAFIEHARLRQDVNWGRDRTLGDNTNRKTGDNFGAADVAAAGPGQYLDLDNAQRGQLGRADAPIFYEVDNPQNPTKVTYWFFYAYNDGPTKQNHEGDFERITIEFDPVTQQPTQANYSAHNNSHTQPAAYADVQKDPATGRPLVYVAGGSHASYVVPGEHATEAPFFKDHTPTDTNRDGRINGSDGAVRIDTAGQLRDVTQQAWYPSAGEGLQWGEIGQFEATSGPRGPSRQKSHFDLPPPAAGDK
ncbi:hypothetical protein BurJ1DRAFT_0059 [Burkholderiales bacterium JOSHI_001]|nr:hypothetical protein BurJ1DRAFT_0059 [Burkholderiales bacterium JOSHI_001]